MYLEGGDLLRITESELLRFGLYVGLDISPETVVQLQKSSARSETRVRAANKMCIRDRHFKLVLQKHELRDIRFHDLRHTCASLLLKNGVPMKDIQEWLGHSDYNTTANIYAHLDTTSKSTSATRMTSVVSINPSICVNV